QRVGRLVYSVADDGLQPDVVADGVQPLGDEQRVRVDAKRRQHFAADRQDAGLQAITRLPDYPITQCERDAQCQVRVDRRHRVVGHDADPAVQTLETIRGIWFHD